ncbi:MAG: hypothetical protein ABFD57_02840 [Smithella sp.]
MKYYTQFHRLPYIYMVPGTIGVGCLGAAVYYIMDPKYLVGYLVCGIFALIAAWILYKSRNNYLDVGMECIEHNGLKYWKIRKADVIRVTHGRKSWAEERDFFLTVHARGQEYHVDSGFLLNEKRVEEIARAMRK